MNLKERKGDLMELMEAIKTRRSVRKFTDEPVPREKLEKIIKAAMWAPSGQNLQPWYFVALTKDEDLAFLISEMGTTAFSERKKLEARFKNNPEVVEETLEFLSAMGGARTILLAFLNKPTYSEDMIPSCIESVSAAMQNAVLMAHAEGIASCWVEAVCQAGDALHEKFAPEHGKLIGGIILGYPAMEPREIPRKAGRFEIR